MEGDKEGATPSTTVAELAEAWLLSQQARGCSPHTIAKRRLICAHFARAIGVLSECTPPRISAYIVRLQQSRRKPGTVWTYTSSLHTFFAWCVEAGLLDRNPMAGLKMKQPKTLPPVPDDDAIEKLLKACPDTWEGRRNRALVAVLADSGLRISEALRVRIEEINFVDRTIRVRGKGQKEAVAFFGADVAHHMRQWLTKRPDARLEDFLFIGRTGRPLGRRHGLTILHRLSKRARLARRISPHQLRHYAATSILRQTGDLELVRQVLRHETLTMALRYAHLTRPDVSAKFRRASPLDNLRAGR
jgi:site-specific recombinase XerD